MPAPPNQDATTAIDLGTLPTTLSQDVRFGGTTFTVWYKYTATSTDIVNTFSFFGDLVGYSPTTKVFLGPDTAPVGYLGGIAATNRPVQIPLTPGVTYFFQVATNSSAADPALLSLDARIAPNLTFPVGSLLVPEAGGNRLFPACIMSAVDGDDYTVLGFRTPWADVRSGDVLANGTILVHSGVDAELQIYDSALVLGIVTAFTPVGSSSSRIRAQRTGGHFYVGETGGGPLPATIRTVSTTLVLGSLFSFPLAGLSGFAVNPDDSIAYFSGQASAFNSQIERWDLLTDMALSDLAPDHGDGVGGGKFFVSSILVLSDGTIAVLYMESAAPSEVEIVVYNPNGTIVGTYNLGAIYETSSSPTLGFALDDPNSFWIGVNYTISTAEGQSRYANIKASDGSILADIDQANYTSGQYDGPQTPTPVSFFGPSGCSGHLLMMLSAVVPPVCPGGAVAGATGAPRDDGIPYTP